ncbi:MULTISPECIES: thioredoxin [Nocardia]|uniref:thioredoxin n=1 Tax=Nocardia TaxID=1817 RepID=UPI0006F892BC|nr:MULTISPECIES: thioredoxin [Nocardia]KQY32444.1 thioredoxin [Nocardia sp. Root136]
MTQSSAIADTVAVTDETFDRDVLAHPGLVLVDVWATWCPSCKMIAPVLAEVARERADTLTVRTLNADENPLTARNYQVMAAPTLLLFRDGQLLRTLVGARSKARLLTELDDAVSR